MGLNWTVQDEPDLTIPEDHIVRAKVKEIKNKTIEWKDKQTGEQKSRDLAVFWFEVVDDRGDGTRNGRNVKLEVASKISNHANNRLRLLAETLLGRELNVVGMNLQSDDLVGLAADITIKHRKADDGRVFEEVDEVMPITGGFDLSDQPPF